MVPNLAIFALCYSLTVKIVAQMRINRPDLAEATLRTLKSVDEDNCLTVLSQVWISVCSLTWFVNSSKRVTSSIDNF